MNQQNWIESTLRPTAPSIAGRNINISCNKTRRSQTEMEQIMLYIKPFLTTGSTDREIYNLLDDNNKLARAGGIKTTYRTIQNIINRARKKFKIYNPRGKYAGLNIDPEQPCKPDSNHS